MDLAWTGRGAGRFSVGPPLPGLPRVDRLAVPPRGEPRRSAPPRLVPGVRVAPDPCPSAEASRMAKGPPKTVALAPDDYAARFVGRTADGRQFFLTHPFVPAVGGDPGREFLALYLFDKDGALLEAR